MVTYPWKCTVLHCNHLGNTWKPLVLMTRHFDYCPSASEGDNQSVGSSAPVVSRCFPGGYNVKLYISRGRLAWWLLAFLHSGTGLHIPRLTSVASRSSEYISYPWDARLNDPAFRDSSRLQIHAVQPRLDEWTNIPNNVHQHEVWKSQLLSYYPVVTGCLNPMSYC